MIFTNYIKLQIKKLRRKSLKQNYTIQTYRQLKLNTERKWKSIIEVNNLKINLKAICNCFKILNIVKFVGNKKRTLDIEK